MCEMEFRKYQHIERFGTTEVEGIEFGETIVFPKLDGSNGSVWLGDDGNVKCGSRRRELSLDDDNQGFCAYVQQHEGIKEYLFTHPWHRLYGEWLVPHSFKGYQKDAWRRFYVFDICNEIGCEPVYVPYNDYHSDLEAYGIDYVVPICTIKNGNQEVYNKLLEKALYLVEDGVGAGEGIVVKNYGYKNCYGRTTWAKIVTNEFKAKHVKEMGVPDVKTPTLAEDKIVEDYCTPDFIEKEYAKIVAANGWSSRSIPELLGRVFSELVREEAWNYVKALKYPTVNYKTLNGLVVHKVKETKPELF